MHCMSPWQNEVHRWKCCWQPIAQLEACDRQFCGGMHAASEPDASTGFEPVSGPPLLPLPDGASVLASSTV
jgi:hypothetical protein